MAPPSNRGNGSLRCWALRPATSAYPDADEFVWNRPIERLLSFGHGQHFCLGVHVARLEITIMITEWLKRVPDFHVDRAAADRPPSSFQWGWSSVPVEVQAEGV
jgi:cytochrome P450